MPGFAGGLLPAAGTARAQGRYLEGPSLDLQRVALGQGQRDLAAGLGDDALCECVNGLGYFLESPFPAAGIQGFLNSWQDLQAAPTTEAGAARRPWA